MKNYDVAVIGGGVHGLFSAYALSKRNLNVVVCEQFEFGHLRGSSHGAVRIFSLSNEDPDYVKLALNSRALWRQLEDDAQVSLIEPNGCIDQGLPEKVSSRISAMDQHSIASEVLSKDEAQYRWPNIEFQESVVYHPGGGRIYARATLEALHERCLSAGVDLKEFFGIKKITQVAKNNVILESENETISADVVVCAAGAWTPGLLEGLVDIPKPKISQEQSLYFMSKDPGAIWPNMYHHFDDFTFYSQEAPGVGVLVSGIRMGTYIDKVQDRDFVVDPLVAIKVCDYVSNYLPGLDPKPIQSDTCVATFFKNGNFVLDRVGDIVILMACQQQAFTFSPALAKAAADLVVNKQFPPLRFRLPNS